MPTTIPSARAGTKPVENTGRFRRHSHNPDHPTQLLANYYGHEAEQLPPLPTLSAGPIYRRSTILSRKLRRTKDEGREHGPIDSSGFDRRMVVQCYCHVCPRILRESLSD